MQVNRASQRSEPVLRTLYPWLTTSRIVAAIVFLVALSQPTLAFGKRHDYWADYLLTPPLVAGPNVSETANNISASINITVPYLGSKDKVYDRLHSRSRILDERLLYVIDALESLDAGSLELRVGKTVFCSPSFNSCKSPDLRLYSTSVDWKDPQSPEPFKFVLSAYRDRTIDRRWNVPAAMIIMYTNNNPTKERTIIGYGEHGIYGTLTLFWGDSEEFPGTSFLQFGFAHDSPDRFQPFYDPDLKELTYQHQGQWIAAGWRDSDLGSLFTLAKYLYYLLAGE